MFFVRVFGNSTALHPSLKYPLQIKIIMMSICNALNDALNPRNNTAYLNIYKSHAWLVIVILFTLLNSACTHTNTPTHTHTHTHIHIQVRKLDTGFSWSRSIVKRALFLTLCIVYEPAMTTAKLPLVGWLKFLNWIELNWIELNFRGGKIWAVPEVKGE